MFCTVVVKMKSSDNVIGQPAFFYFEMIDNINYSVVCTASDQESFSVLTYNKVLFMCEIVLRKSIAIFHKQISIA